MRQLSSYISPVPSILNLPSTSERINNPKLDFLLLRLNSLVSEVAAVEKKAEYLASILNI